MTRRRRQPSASAIRRDASSMATGDRRAAHSPAAVVVVVVRPVDARRLPLACCTLQRASWRRARRFDLSPQPLARSLALVVSRLASPAAYDAKNSRRRASNCVSPHTLRQRRPAQIASVHRDPLAFCSSLHGPSIAVVAAAFVFVIDAHFLRRVCVSNCCMITASACFCSSSSAALGGNGGGSGGWLADGGGGWLAG